MNTGQNSKYWRRWAAVCHHNNWRWIKGRLSAEAVKDTGPHHTAVWVHAEQLANQACRAVTADDLRHACHVHAFGRDISHSSLTNRQFDRLLLLWGNEREMRGLLNTDDIRAQVLWDHPDQAEKLSLVHAIKLAAAHEYICSITRDVFGTEYWEDLDAKQLLGLLRKIKGNSPAQTGQPW